MTDDRGELLQNSVTGSRRGGRGSQKSQSAGRVLRRAHGMLRRVVRALRPWVGRRDLATVRRAYRQCRRRAESFQGRGTQLPRLEEMFDGGVVAGLFEQQWPRFDAHGQIGVAIRHCRLRGAVFRPSTGCLTMHDLTVQQPGLPAWQTIGIVGCTGRKAWVQLLSDDPELPWLASAVDADVMLERFGSVPDLASGGIPERCTVVPVSYHPGRRCTLRYDVYTPQEMRTFYGKTLRRGSEQLAASISALYDQSLSITGMPSFPRPLAYWPDLHMLIMQRVRGMVPADRYLFDTSASEAARLRLVRDLGAQLATLHRCGDILGRRRTLSDRLRWLKDRIRIMRALDPALARRFARLVARIETRTDIEPEQSLVVSYGTIDLRDVLVRGSYVDWIDPDDVCCANPAWDIGGFLAYMDRTMLRRPDQAAWIQSIKDDFLSGYNERGPALNEHLVGLHRAACLLDVALNCFGRLWVLERPREPYQLLDAATVVLDGIK